MLVERIIGEGNGSPLQCSCLEDPRDGGAWWAAVYGVTQSRTRLKQLSSSSRENNLEAVAKVEGSLIPIIGTPANLIGTMLGAIVCGVAGAIAINLINRYIAEQQKTDNAQAQAEKRNEII